MSEYEENDGWAEWSASYEADPVLTAAQLAAAYSAEAAAQHAPDPVQIAQTAALMVNTQNEIAAEQARTQDESRILSWSMAAEYGSDWARFAPEVGERLAAREDLSKSYNECTTAHGRLQVLDKVFHEIRDERDQDAAEFRKIKQAGQTSYWQTPAARDVLDQVQK